MSAPQHPLVELASSSLALLAQVPRFGEEAKRNNSAAELERAWVRAPLSVAIGGAVPARTELVNYLCDRKVLDPTARPLACAALRIRRGKSTRFKATRDDGTTEEHVLPGDKADEESLRSRARAAKATVDERKLALQRIERALPRGARARPRGFWIFLWPIWWLLTRRHRRVLAERSLSEHAYDQACDALTHAEQELETSASRIRVERSRFFESLRALSSGLSLGGTVREVELVLAEGPLPSGVDLIELVRPKASEPVDAVLIVERDAFYAPHVDGEAPRIGSIAETVPNFLGLLGRTRALVLARRAREQLEPAVAQLDDDVNDTVESFRVRIERLEAMQILDANEFVRTELAKAKTQVVPGVRLIIERAATYLGAELDRVHAEWAHAVSISQDADQLKGAVARIEGSAAADAKRIADEVRNAVIDSTARHIADVLPEVLMALRPHGLDEPAPRTPPMLQSFDVLPSLVNVEKSKKLSGFLGGLFKSFESRRTDVLAKAEQRIATLREVAGAELLGIEPRLREIIEQQLHQQLHAAIQRQIAWLDKALAAEREAVAADGARLAPLARQRDKLKADLAQLTEGIEQLERENPGLAAAAAAA